MQIDTDVGEALQKLGKQGGHPFDPKGHRHSETHQTSRTRGLLARGCLQFLGIPKHPACLVEQRRTELCQGQLARGAIKKPPTQSPFQPCHCSRHGRHRQIELPRRAGERALLCHLGKQGEAFQIGEMAHFIFAMMSFN